MRLLVAEMDPALGEFLKSSFEAENYVVDLRAEIYGDTTNAHLPNYDAAILDLKTPIEEGMRFLDRLRSQTGSVPILVLASPSRPDERGRLLDAGADDLVIKPLAFSELAARLRALLRRGATGTDATLRVEDLELNRIEHSVRRAGRRLDLTPKEFALLEYLMRNAGRRVARSEIIERVWNLSFSTMTNVVDVYINCNGNSSTTSVEIATGESVNVNVPGDQLFLNSSGSVFGAINSLITAVQSGNGISAALTSLGRASSQFDSERLNYGTTLSQLQSTSNFLTGQSVELSAQQDNIDGANLPAVTTQFDQAQIAYTSLIEGESRVLDLPTLLNFLE